MKWASSLRVLANMVLAAFLASCGDGGGGGGGTGGTGGDGGGGGLGGLGGTGGVGGLGGGGSGGGGGGSGGGGGGGGGDFGEALCVAICEEQKAQDCNPISDCAAECADDAARNEATGCAAEYIAFGECVQAMPDICDDEMDACGTELGAYWTCVNEFCTANPGSDYC